MLKKNLLIAWFIVFACAAIAQEPQTDSLALPANNDTISLSMDSTLDYDALLDELDLFLDSLLAPRSYTLVSVSAGQGYFNYIIKNTRRITTARKYIWSPTLGFYGKGGFGFTAAGFIINDSAKLNLYQLAFTPSYDYLSDRRLATGISFTRYRTKNSLSFYTSPLQNEVNGYFLWRKSWLQPGITINYGWGSRSAYTARLVFLDSLKKRALLFNHTEESVSDFSMAVSLRHDFYWLNIFGHKDFFKLSPLLSYSIGTQKFGFNRTTGISSIATSNVLYNTRLVSLDNTMKLQPISLTMYLRAEYYSGKFFIQPQLLLDYYFPGETKNFTTLFSINTGIMF
jgi:hypothetical protein